MGCGTGATTIELSSRVQPGGKVTGVDISEPLILRARDRARAHEARIDFELADASRHPFAAGAFDVLFSRFGIMFFDDPEGAFGHLRAALAPGGRAAFVCWRDVAENEWFSVPYRAARKVLPQQPPPDPYAPGPFAFGDRDRLESILHRGGFTGVTITAFDATLYTAGSVDEALDQSMRVGPLARMLAEHSEDVRQRGVAAIRAELAERATAEGVALGGATWIVTAHA